MTVAVLARNTTSPHNQHSRHPPARGSRHPCQIESRRHGAAALVSPVPPQLAPSRAADRFQEFTHSTAGHVIDDGADGSGPKVVEPQRHVIQGTTLYAAIGWDGFEVIDLADPRNPQIVATLAMPYRTVAVAVAAPYGYVVGRTLDVIDIQGPLPQVVASASTFSPQDVALSDPYAYVADGDSGIAVIDIADPLHPALVGRAPTFSSTYAVQVAGSHAYLLDETGGLLVADISCPENPRIVGRLPAASVAPDVRSNLAVSGDYAYVGRYAPGALHVVDVSNPESPRIAGGVDVMCGVRAIAAVGTVAYVANGGGLQVVDVSDPARPRILGDAEIRWDATCVAVSEFQAYVGQSPGDEELRVLELQCQGTAAVAGRADPSAAPELRIYPCPARGGATIRLLASTDDGCVGAWISDVGGRLLRWLTPSQAGPHELFWDGRDARGREVAPGLYFVRAVEGGSERAGRILLVR